MKCRVCGAAQAVEIGEVEYLSGFSWKVFDCFNCRCRFTQHDDSVYERLHATGAISYYGGYRDLAARCKSLFEQSDHDELRRLLCETAKYRYIIEEIERESPGARVLEIGCSRGYLTSVFILKGCRAMGVDVSAEAVESARAAFGDHFAVAGAPPVAAGAPYDVIYHVGMIGCVADPLGLTKSLLTILKPGGRLLFNAPNRDSCYLRGQLWLDSAPPPDLVTLFPPGFWPRQFESVAEVRERAESWPVERSVEIGLRKVFGRRWRKPVPVPLANARERTAGTGYSPARLWRKFEQVVAKAGRITGLSRLAPKQPSEFGLYVSMTKRGEIAN